MTLPPCKSGYLNDYYLQWKVQADAIQEQRDADRTLLAEQDFKYQAYHENLSSTCSSKVSINNEVPPSSCKDKA